MTMRRLCFCFGNKQLEAASGDPAEAVKDVFCRYSDNDGLVGPAGLQRFLVEVQGEVEATREAALQIMDSMRVDQFKRLSLDAFFRYLAADDNSPLDPSLGVSLLAKFILFQLFKCFMEIFTNLVEKRVELQGVRVPLPIKMSMGFIRFG